MNQSTSMDGPAEGSGSPTESLVRTVLRERADALPPESPAVDGLRRRGRRRRRMREAAASVVAVVLVGGVALGAYAASGGSPGHATIVVGGSSAPATATGTGEATPGPDSSVPPGWQPGPKLQVPTYTSVPSWMKKTSASDEFGADATRNHDIGSMAPYLGCLSLGSSPLLWPEGFYAEGTPLTVFDSHGRAVYVLDEGFTGVDGFPRLGWGDGRLSSGYSLTGCPAGLTAIASSSLLIIFS